MSGRHRSILVSVLASPPVEKLELFLFALALEWVLAPAPCFECCAVGSARPRKRNPGLAPK